jgi:predicted RNA-binding Zn-ribbon protein involved in translation (DUF1610 family)
VDHGPVGAYNRLLCPWHCPRCGHDLERAYQFKWGDTWQHDYRLGERVRWGGNDQGTPGVASAKVDAFPEPCPNCGWLEDAVYDLTLESDVLRGVSVPRPSG